MTSRERSPMPGPDAGYRLVRALALLLLVVAAFIAWPYRAAILFSLVVGYLTYPLFVKLRDRVRWPPGAALVVILVVTLALVAPFVALSFAFVQQATMLADAVAEPDGVEEIVAGALRSVGVPESRVQDATDQFASGVAGALEGVVVPAFRALVEFGFGLIVFYILLYFILVDGKSVVEWLARLLPMDDARRERLFGGAAERVKALVWGSLIIAVVEGVLAGIGWWLLGFPAPVFWGFVMVILAIVPVLGPFVVLLPAGLIALAQGNIWQGVGMLVLNFLIVGLVDDFLRAYVVGHWTSVHPAIILVGIVGGIPVFGLSGLILGPLLLSLTKPVLEAWLLPGEGALDVSEEDEDEGEEDAARDAARRRHARRASGD